MFPAFSHQRHDGARDLFPDVQLLRWLLVWLVGWLVVVVVDVVVVYHDYHDVCVC